jgi:hypothetical protein
MGGLLLALLLGIAAGVLGVRMVAAGGRPMVTPAAVVKEIQTLSQLVTIQYVIEKVVVEQDVKWYGENRVLLVAHGVVKAGVDFRHLEEDDIKVSGTTIQIDLPPPHILDAYLDESKTQMIEHSTGMLRLFDEDLETVARQHAVLDIRKAAKDEGILNDAVERAQTQIRALLRRFGYEEVEFAGP